MKSLKTFLFAFVGLCLPFVASAHEVYVLDKATIKGDLARPALDLWHIALSNENIVFTYGLGIFLALIVVFGISISRTVESWCDPVLFRIKKYAGHMAQITFGSALIASAYYMDLFGTELSFDDIFGAYHHEASLALFVIGVMILAGIYTRVASLVAFVIFMYAAGEVGQYMVSYLTYFGEAVCIFVFGGGYSLIEYIPGFIDKRKLESIEHKKYFVLRIAFGISLLYAAFYAKFLHGTLALDTVLRYHLTDYFHFPPEVVVLGAFMVELTVAIFYLAGFEVRFTSLIFLGFLTASLIFFGESVWPHIILIGTGIAMLMHGYDEYTIEHPWYRKDKREPVL